jgi:hypothetical protein
MSNAKEILSGLVMRNILLLMAGAIFLLWPHASSLVRPRFIPA